MANATTDGVGQELLLEVWQQHGYSEFVMEDAKAALTTMSDNPHVLMGPIAAGGRGRDGVYKFYRDLFLAQIPAHIRPYSSRKSSEKIFSPKRPFTSLRTIESWTG